MNIDQLTNIVGNLTYGALALIALWGAYCVAMAWRRVATIRFPNEELQNEFLQQVEEPLLHGDFDRANAICEGDRRAMCQLAHLAIINHKLGMAKVRQLVVDRFQRDVMADLEHRLSWINTVIKSAPMLGLFGTVIGMMGAFAKLATAESVEPDKLAGNIQVALITTACGLAIAIPLVLAVASINIRMRRLEDLVGAGLNRFFEAYREGINRTARPR